MASPTRVLFRFRPSLAATLLCLLVATLWLAGGSSRADALGQALVRATAFFALIVVLLFGSRPTCVDAKPIAYLLGAAILLAMIQLIPLPPAIWSALPGRAIFEGATFGQPAPWRPLAIAPSATWNAAASLVVPLSVLVLVSALSDKERALLPALVLGIIAAGSLLAVLQFSGAAVNNPFINDLPGEIGGNFANRNHFALFMAIGCLVATMWMLGKDRVRIGRLASALGFILLFALLVLAGGSRAGLVLALLALAIGLLMVWINRARLGRSLPRWTGQVIVAASVLLVALLVGVSVGLDRAIAIDRLFTLDPGQDLRGRALPTIIDAIRVYFPFGSGLGGFDPVFRIHEPFELLGRVYLNHAHNDYLEIVLDAGLLGLLLLIGAIGWWAFASVRVWRAKSDPDVTLGQLGSAILLLVLVASAFDYPARTPMIMAIVTIAGIWLNGGARAAGRLPLPIQRRPL